MWDLPGPGLEPVSPALAGGFLTTAPPGEPRTSILNPSDITNTDPETWPVAHTIKTLGMDVPFLSIKLYRQPISYGLEGS